MKLKTTVSLTRQTQHRRGEFIVLTVARHRDDAPIQRSILLRQPEAQAVFELLAAELGYELT
jgi:hypothetical protein